MFIVAAGQIQDPYVPHLGELGARGFIQMVRAVLGVTAQSLVGDHVCLVVFARGYSDVTLGGQNFYLRPAGKRLGKVSVKS